jgi:hypothetical protein
MADAASARSAGLWSRWKALARRAAVIQSNVLLFILYFLVFLPIALVRRIGTPRFGSHAGWQPHGPEPHDLDAARRQF